MIPVFQPHTLNDFTKPLYIQLVKDSRDCFCWNIKNGIPPGLKKNSYNVEFNEEILKNILDAYRKFCFVHFITNIMLYNDLDMSHMLKYNFELFSDGIQFTYFLEENEIIWIPPMIKENFLKVSLSVVSNRPSLKIIVRHFS